MYMDPSLSEDNRRRQETLLNHDRVAPRINSQPVLICLGDERTEHSQEEVPWCILFTDNIVLIHKTHSKVNDKTGDLETNPRVKMLQTKDT